MAIPQMQQSITATGFPHFIAVIARVSLSVVFLVSGAMKLIDLPAFASTIGQFIDIDLSFRVALGVVISVSELVFATLLLSEKTFDLAGLGIIILTLTFTLVQAWALTKPDPIDCSCFGSLVHETIGWQTMLRNIIIIIAASYIIRHRQDREARTS